jgi:autotransporter-associated beta strand protein
MRKTHDQVVPRRRFARRALAVAASGLVLTLTGRARADDVWSPTNFPLNWSVPGWWSTGLPATGTVADLFSGTLTCTFNVASSGDLKGVQVAGGDTLNLTASGTAAANYVLETANLAVGGTVTGQITGSSSNSGSGIVNQNTSFMEIDPGGSFSVDAASSYVLNGIGNLVSGANEQLAGSFSQGGGTNQVTGGSTLNNSGSYSISSSTALILSDNDVNSGTFTESNGTLEGYTAPGSTGNFNFSNTGTFNYTSGNFYGVMNNSGSVQVNATTVPFTKGIVNNGLLTINGSTGTFTGSISGGVGGEILFKGATNLTLTGSNSYLGLTVISAGTVMLNCPLGNSSNNYGGAFQGPVTVDTGATLENLAGNQLAGNATLTINGGTYNLNGYDNSVGAINFSTGNITTTSGGPGIGVNSSNTSPGMITTTRGASTITGGIRCSNTLEFNVSGGAPLTVTGVIGSYNASLGIPLVLTGGGTLSISGASRLSTIDVQNGTLLINEGGNLGGLNTSLDVENGGALSVANQTLSVGDLIGGSSSTIDLGTGGLTVNSIKGSSYPGTFTGSGSLSKSGSGTFTLTGNESAGGGVNVSAGTLTFSTGSNFSGGSLSVSSGATLNLDGSLTTMPAITTNGTVNVPQNGAPGVTSLSLGAVSIGTGGASGQLNLAAATPHANRTLLQVNSLSFGGSSGAWVGQLDLSNNDMVIHNSNFAAILNQAKSGYNNGQWNGPGIASTTAAADTTHLTALGVISNDLGGGTPLYSLASNMPFDGTYPVATDLLLKYTYYGDANLDGQVNSTDYSLIDNGFLNNLSGWYNGDFNYDGVVNGSDYSLIDNAFNLQGPNLSTSAEVASVTAQIAAVAPAASAVPEPLAGLWLVLAGSSLLRRRRGESIE